MSKDWTPGELQAASDAMMASGHMSYTEFCEELERQGFATAENTHHAKSGEL